MDSNKCRMYGRVTTALGWFCSCEGGGGEGCGVPVPIHNRPRVAIVL